MNPRPDKRTPVRAYLAFLVLVLAGLATFSLAPTASAATPCGKKVLGDWFDNGRIDKIYPLNCYEEAIDAIPADIRDYADAEDVITRALQLALNGKVGASGPDPSPNGKGGGEKGGGETGGGSGEPPTQAAPDVNTAGPSSVPVPLLVLGGLSLALLAAGGLGYVARRRQAAEAADSDDPDSLH